MLQIKNLTIEGLNKELLHDLNLEINSGETHVIMGPNGAGKSTICKAILSHPSLKKTKGTILWNEEDITHEVPSAIAQKGIYYISQSPMEVEGITNAELLRTSLQEKNEPMNIFQFNKECTKICEKLEIPKSFLHREVNRDLSGGEKKKNELIGMWLLKPKLIVLDEIDSGLDVDAIKVVAKNLKEYQQESNCSILLVSHQPTLIQLLKPQFTHLVMNQTIVLHQDESLAFDLLKNGFSSYSGTNVMMQKEEKE